MLFSTSSKIALLGLLLFIPLVTQADVYTYTDKNGVVHITNRPPKDKKAKLVTKKKDVEPKSSSEVFGSGVTSASALPKLLPAAAATYDPMLREAAENFDLPLALLRAICHSESAFQPDAVSHMGAQGLMQLMPATSARMGVIDPFDPKDNILGGARYLKWLSERFGGDLVLMISAYHAGEGAVDKYNGIPPYSTTRSYVTTVLSRYYRYKNLP